MYRLDTFVESAVWVLVLVSSVNTSFGVPDFQTKGKLPVNRAENFVAFKTAVSINS